MKKYRNKVTGVIDRVQNIAIVRMVQGVMGINKDNQLSAFAAQAAFFLLLSFFPFAMMLLIGIRFLPVTQAEFVALIEEIIPGDMANMLSYMVDEIYKCSGWDDNDHISDCSNLVGSKGNDGDRTGTQFYGSDKGY